MRKFSHNRGKLNFLGLVSFSPMRTPLALMVKACGGDLTAASAALNLLYWLPNTTHPDGYVYKSDADWRLEIGVEGRRVRRIHSLLSALGFEMTVLAHATGRATHYRLNLRQFCKVFATILGVSPLKIFAIFTGKLSDPSSHSSRTGQTKMVAPTTNKTTDKTHTTTVAVAEVALPLSQNAEGSDAQLDDHPTNSAPASYVRLKALGVSGRALMQFAALPITELERALAYVRERNPRNIAGMLVECLRQRWYVKEPVSLALPSFMPESFVTDHEPSLTEPATEPERQDSWLEAEPTPAPVPTHERVWKQTIAQIMPGYRNGEASFLRRDPVVYDAGTNTYTLTISPYNRYGHLMRATLERTLADVAKAFGLSTPALVLSEIPVQEPCYV